MLCIPPAALVHPQSGDSNVTVRKSRPNRRPVKGHVQVNRRQRPGKVASASGEAYSAKLGLARQARGAKGAHVHHGRSSKVAPAPIAPPASNGHQLAPIEEAAPNSFGTTQNQAFKDAKKPELANKLATRIALALSGGRVEKTTVQESVELLSYTEKVGPNRRKSVFERLSKYCEAGVFEKLLFRLSSHLGNEDIRQLSKVSTASEGTPVLFQYDDSAAFSLAGKEETARSLLNTYASLLQRSKQLGNEREAAKVIFAQLKSSHEAGKSTKNVLQRLQKYTDRDDLYELLRKLCNLLPPKETSEILTFLFEEPADRSKSGWPFPKPDWVAKHAQPLFFDHLENTLGSLDTFEKRINFLNKTIPSSSRYERPQTVLDWLYANKAEFVKDCVFNGNPLPEQAITVLNLGVYRHKSDMKRTPLAHVMLDEHFSKTLDLYTNLNLEQKLAFLQIQREHPVKSIRTGQTVEDRLANIAANAASMTRLLPKLRFKNDADHSHLYDASMLPKTEPLSDSEKQAIFERMSLHQDYYLEVGATINGYTPEEMIASKIKMLHRSVESTCEKAIELSEVVNVAKAWYRKRADLMIHVLNKPSSEPERKARDSEKAELELANTQNWKRAWKTQEFARLKRYLTTEVNGTSYATYLAKHCGYALVYMLKKLDETEGYDFSRQLLTRQDSGQPFGQTIAAKLAEYAPRHLVRYLKGLPSNESGRFFETRVPRSPNGDDQGSLIISNINKYAPRTAKAIIRAFVN